jgi:hypothetical protein
MFENPDLAILFNVQHEQHAAINNPITNGPSGLMRCSISIRESEQESYKRTDHHESGTVRNS